MAWIEELLNSETGKIMKKLIDAESDRIKIELIKIAIENIGINKEYSKCLQIIKDIVNQ